MATAPESVALVGTGLIGGSIGLALRRAGIVVRGFDHDAARAAAAHAARCARRRGRQPRRRGDRRRPHRGRGARSVTSPRSSSTRSTPGATLVTDVGSVKAPVVTAVEAARPDLAPRFVGGHPMAGSEQEGLAGASADLFVGATWVLTPTARTDPAVFATVRSWVAAFGAEPLAVTPELHDALVAVVSHVPQLAASTLMNVASAGNDEHAVLLRLAAGGFRDMTRIASSHPAIWPDICLANRDAIVGALDRYLDELTRVRAIVAGGERADLLELLESARAARRNLPTGIPADAHLFELRVPVPDREGVIAEVTTLGGALRREHRRPRDRPLARGPQRCARARRRRAGPRRVRARAARARLPRRPDPARMRSWS